MFQVSVSVNVCVYACVCILMCLGCVYLCVLREGLSVRLCVSCLCGSEVKKRAVGSSVHRMVGYMCVQVQFVL